MYKLILLFTVIPLLELGLLIKISDYVGVIFTISLVAVTGMIGAFLTKKQGTAVVKKIEKSLAAGKMPAESLIDGMIILIGGVMLITPGLLTDLGGFSCIIPLTRVYVKKIAKGRLSKIIQTGSFQFNPDGKETKTIDVVDEEQEDEEEQE